MLSLGYSEELDVGNINRKIMTIFVVFILIFSSCTEEAGGIYRYKLNVSESLKSANFKKIHWSEYADSSIDNRILVLPNMTVIDYDGTVSITVSLFSENVISDIDISSLKIEGEIFKSKYGDLNKEKIGVPFSSLHLYQIEVGNIRESDLLNYFGDDDTINITILLVESGESFELNYSIRKEFEESSRIRI